VKPINIIEEVRDHKDQERGLWQIKGLMLHRCGVDLRTGTVLGYDGLSVARAFTGKMPHLQEVAKATGFQNAYTFMVNAGVGPHYFNGSVWQALPLDEVGWHGRRFSRGWVGCAWIGDPRVQPISRHGWDAMVKLCAGLCQLQGLDPMTQIKGHGEVKDAHGGEKAPGRRASCPGLSISKLDEFRRDVRDAGTVDLEVVLSA
jgi:hypothetical protein